MKTLFYGNHAQSHIGDIVVACNVHVFIFDQMKSSPPKKEKSLTDWQAPVIFKTSDFFGLSSTEEQSTDSAKDSAQDTEKLTSDDQMEESTTQITDR